MNKMMKLGMAVWLFASSVATTFAAAHSPVGHWRAIDDVTGKPKAIVNITETADHQLVGRILQIFPGPGHTVNEVCKKCSGERRNQRIVGMIILEKFKANKVNDNAWRNGEILDPRSGKVYQSTIKLIESGQKLDVRGYIGMPLFGRSQTWERLSGPELPN